MAFKWDWLFLNIIDYGILNYYQANVCSNYTDFVLYQMARDRGIVLPEVHIIMRTSPSCYRLVSFLFDHCEYKSFKTAKAVCEYIIKNFIPDYVKPKTSAEKMKILREQRKARQEATGEIRPGFTAGEREEKGFTWEINEMGYFRKVWRR